MQEIHISKIPISSVSQMTQIDHEMVENFHIPIQKMMKYATQAIHQTISNIFEIEGKTFSILAGKGNNGGDGIGVALDIKKSGGTPIIILSHSQLELTQDSLHQLKLAQADKITIIKFENSVKYEIQSIIRKSDYIIDALVGYNLRGNPKEPIASLVRMANESKLPILSIDVPTGLSPDKGRPSNPTIKAKATLCLSTVKKGLIKPSANKFVGQMFLSDLSIPSELYRKAGISYIDPFGGNLVIKVNK